MRAGASLADLCRRILIRLVVAVIWCRFPGCLSAQAGLSLSSAVASPETTTRLSLFLTYTDKAPAGLEWTLAYPGNQIAEIGVKPGSAAIAAGKDLSCVSAPGLYKCLLSGLNANMIPPGVAADIYIRLTPGTVSTSITISDITAVDTAASGMAISDVRDATLSVPALSALMCVPATLNPGQTAKCSVSLNAAAPDGGIRVALYSNSGLVTVPDTVTIAPGSTSAAFSALTGLVGGAQSTTLTASWNGGFTTANLSLAGQPLLSALICSPSVLSYGTIGACTVMTSTVAPASGYRVSLTADNANLTVPAFATVLAGSTTASAVIGIKSIDDRESATVTAILSGSVQQASVILLPATAPAISDLFPGSVTAGSQRFTIAVQGSAFSDSATIQWNGLPLPTTFVNSGRLEGIVEGSLIASAGVAKITVLDARGSSSAAVAFTIGPPGPTIVAGGVVPIYSSAPVIQAGSWISIYGKNLAGGTFVWNGDFPTSLGGVTVTVDEKPGYLSLVSPGQITLQAPDDNATGTVVVAVTTPFGKATSEVTLSQFGPSFALFDAVYPAAVILTPDGSGNYGNGTYDLLGPPGYFSFNTRPAAAGEIVELYGVGFGPTVPSIPAGQPFQGAAPATNQVSVTIGGVPAKVLFIGITSAGLYQLNFVVPEGGGGDQVLQATAGGIATPGGIRIATK